MNQKGFSPLIIILSIILVIGIAGVAYYIFTNSTKSEQQSKTNNQFVNIPTAQPTSIQQATATIETTNSKPYIKSSTVKELASDKFGFKVSYPDKWSYYPKQQYIETNFILTPEFNGTMVEIDVIKNSDYYTEVKFNSEPFAHKDSLKAGYTTTNLTSSSGLVAKVFEGDAKPDYLSSNNLKGNYKVKIVQYLKILIFYLRLVVK